MHVDIGIPMTNHLIFIVFLTITKNLKYFENFEVCLSSEITLRKSYLQYEVRVKTVLQASTGKNIASYENWIIMKLIKMLESTLVFALYSLF